jgi:hypothetical protein
MPIDVAVGDVWISGRAGWLTVGCALQRGTNICRTPPPDLRTNRWLSGQVSGQVRCQVESCHLTSSAFGSIRESRGLADDFQAVGELSKGKQTTDPAHHSGLGIFYTSKMADRFVLSANQLVWTVNDTIGDITVGWLDKSRTGTLVRCEIRHDTERSLQSVQSAISDPLSNRLNKTILQVALFREGDSVSRSEAKLLGGRALRASRSSSRTSAVSQRPGRASPRSCSGCGPTSTRASDWSRSTPTRRSRP